MGGPSRGHKSNSSGNLFTILSSSAVFFLAVALYDKELALKLLLVTVPLVALVVGLVYVILKVDAVRLRVLKHLLQQRVIINNPKSIWHKPVVGSIGLLVGRDPKLYSLQEALPSLPVPPLKQTLQKFLLSVEPLLSKEDFEETKKAAEHFEQNEGPILQKVLLERAQKEPNWLREWWENYVYLAGRLPLAPSSNFYGTDRLDKLDLPRFTRLSHCIRALLMFKQLLDTEQLEPLKMIVLPLCMDQYRRIYSTIRCPGKQIDSIVHHENASHLVVFCKGQIFKLDLVVNNRTLNVEEIEQQLKYILDHATEEPGVGVFTSQGRTEWAEDREALLANSAKQLQIVESSLFAVALDDVQPTTLENHSSLAWLSNMHNRWLDKSFTLVSFADGSIGVNCEHTWADAPVLVHVFDYVFGVEDSASWPDDDLSVRANLPPPEPLIWNLTPSLLQRYEVALAQSLQLSSQLQLKILLFEHFGKGLIKKCNLSPDGFVQMALQATYYKLNNGCCLTYESSHTRQFLYGRTETVRTTSNDSLHFCQAFVSTSASPKEKLNSLKTAISSHLKYMRSAMEGQGVDRHLFGLLVLSKGLIQMGQLSALPKLFESKGWKQDFKLSTSQTPAFRTRGGGFAPTAADGYGVSYVVAEDLLTFHISSWAACPTTSAESFANTLSETLLQLRSICVSTPEMRLNLSKGELNKD